MVCAGIDGSKGGWISVIRRAKKLEVYHARRIGQIFQLPYHIDLALVDIPVGIGSQNAIREVEQLARNQLRPYRHSSVFNPPVREAMDQGTYQEACEANRNITGKKISKQSWNLVPRIKETDGLLREMPYLRGRLLEAHPELCFKYLNYGKIPVHRKREVGRKGLEERIAILVNHFQDSENFYRHELQQLHRSQASPDDLLDALCLCLTATLGGIWGLDRLQPTPTRDKYGIEMNMHYFNPARVNSLPKL